MRFGLSFLRRTSSSTIDAAASPAARHTADSPLRSSSPATNKLHDERSTPPDASSVAGGGVGVGGVADADEGDVRARLRSTLYVFFFVILVDACCSGLFACVDTNGRAITSRSHCTPTIVPSTPHHTSLWPLNGVANATLL
jgi:hypothetical protein